MASNYKKSDEPRVNNRIKAEQVRLVDASGEMIGVVSIAEAISKARSYGLDLVEVSPNATPPVCKILDYGKFKYEAQKKANEARKKQKVIHLKEIKLRPNIDPHDFGIKMKNVHKFLDAGDKVKVTLRFRGREMSHQQIGMDVMNKVKEEVAEKARVELEPKMEGRQAVMILAPLSQK
jgi:translation initiation factor IF-3